MLTDSKIYIFVPVLKTGGPHSLHQLGYAMAQNGINVYMVYYNDRNQDTIVYEEYSDLLKVAHEIEDSCNNYLITPETSTAFIYRYRHIKKIIWWLSRDYFLDADLKKRLILNFQDKIHLPAKLIEFSFPLLKARYIHKRRKLELFSIDFYFVCASDLTHKDVVLHLYNCEHAHQYIKKLGIPEEKTAYLCGPIDKEFVMLEKAHCISEKKNMIAYNPAKVTPELIEIISKIVLAERTDISFLKIQNMTPAQVRAALKQSKVYLDLGFFPGPERIPREAVSLYCNLLTSKTGAAKNEIDVPIPEKYKFDINNNPEVYRQIAESLIDLIDHYEEHIEEFEPYRLKVTQQIKEFDQRVKMILDRLSTSRPKQGVRKNTSFSSAKKER
ncbi:MAG: hypothetical protein IK134_01990 [Oscillospiraceae bacterium]|nr:hypothetical protein [Oscillospiraceae bacterium]